MTMQEAIEKREELLVEQRKLNQAKRILESESIVPNQGIKMAISQYARRLEYIDEEIRALADQVETQKSEPVKPETVKIEDIRKILFATDPKEIADFLTKLGLDKEIVQLGKLLGLC